MRLAVIAVCLILVGACGSPNVAGPSDRPSLPLPPVASAIAHGIVSDPAGIAIMGAAVEWAGLSEAWGDRGPSAETDQDGFYKLPIGPPGAPGTLEGVIWIRATKDGYATQEVQVHLDSLEVNFVLTPNE
jgi:hypothetical protein